MHSELYEYCIRNVKITERPDDSVIIEKVYDHARIDAFDASVNAAVRMLKNKQSLEEFDEWLDQYDKNNQKKGY